MPKGEEYTSPFGIPPPPFFFMQKRRAEKFQKVVACRQPDLTVILENVWDSHNIGAVLRSCDSVGISEIYLLDTEGKLVKDRVTVGKRTSGGAVKWVDVKLYDDRKACFDEVRKKHTKIFGTHLDEEAVGLHDLELAEPVALLFGNEHLGITPETLEMCDGNFLIPQYGMAESLNISVACAVSLYEALRQRQAKGYYGENVRMGDREQAALLQEYTERHTKKLKPKRTFHKNER